MTVSVQVSVNGSYKLPIKYRQGDRVVEKTISGRGLDHPFVELIHFSHGADVMTLEIGPESQDLGEPEQPADEVDVAPMAQESDVQEALDSGDDNA